MSEPGSEKSAGAGSWALRGFDYQVDVSVWLALDLMVASRLAAEMTLEPVSDEDVEADIEEFEPGTVAEAVPMRKGYRLIVQAKRRTGNAWTEAPYISLLHHGKRRLSAKARLEADPHARYLLVTSAGLNSPVSRLGVRKAGSWPGVAKASARIAKVGTNIAGRLAIIHNQDDERLVRDIKELVLERFRVPRARWEEALKRLREEAWARMRGTSGGVWTREEIEGLIAEHEGYLVTGSERDDYVQPTNWGDLTQALTSHNAIIIIGQSGSGKTAAADALWQHCKAKIPDLKRVHITHGPDQLRTDETTPPVFYEIEDPWGRFKFEPESRPWNDQLAPALRQARHDRLIVATSRIDVAQSSGAIDSIRLWRMPLDAENYGRAERQALYRNLSRGLPRDLLAFAHEREALVLQELSLPLELRKFFDALPSLDREELGKNPAAAFAKAIEQAHRESIEQTVVEQIEAREAIKPAAILWALIKPYGRLSADVLRSIEDPLVDSDSSLEDQIGPLVNSFIVARNLRQGADGSLTYYHGKVEAGIETVLAAHPQPVRRVMRTLVDVLLGRDDEVGDRWGVETAAEIMNVSRRIPGATPQLSQASQARIDAFAEARLQAEGRGLEQAIRFAATVGSERSNLAEFARWLEYRPDPGFPGLMNWGKPERTGAWRARMRGDPAVRALAEKFIREALPTDNTSFPKSFVSHLRDVAGDLTEAFVDAALSSAGYGFIANDDVIAAGALADLNGFERVVDAVVDALTPTEADRARWERDRLLIWNDEVPEDYAEHLAGDGEGMTAETYLKAYVEKARAERGFRAISEHRHLEKLGPIWLHLLVKEPSIALQEGELKVAVDKAYGTDAEADLWHLLIRNWDPIFTEKLVERMIHGSDSESVRRAALDCLMEHIPERMPDVVAGSARAAGDARFAQLSSDLAHRASKRGYDAKDRTDAALTLISELPGVWQELAKAEIDIGEDGTPILSREAAAALAAISDPSEDVRATRLQIAQHMDFDASDDVRWMLQRSDDHDNAVAAIDVAVRRGMTAELEASLDHRFAHVAARALTALAEPLTAPLPAHLLARVGRKSSPVRKALLAQLAAKPHPEHLSTLVILAADEWQKWSPQQNDDDNFPIARGALDAIAELSSVPADILDTFIGRARATEDLGLMWRMLSCAVLHGGPAHHALIVDMSRKGKRIVVGRAAASTLFTHCDRLNGDIIASITDEMVLRLPAMIAIYHVATIGLSAAAERIEALAAKLAGSDDRRIFLAILAAARRDNDSDQGAAIAAMLPKDHPVRQWAEGEKLIISRDALINLGDASSVKEALRWMKPDG